MSGPAGELPAVLAIDGGNSKTDVALVAADGTLLATQRGPGSNWQIVGKDEALRVLRDLVAATAGAAGLAPGSGSALDGSPVAACTSACLAGADLPDEEEQLNDLVRAQHWSAENSVVNDTFAVLRAGLDGRPAAPAGEHWPAGQHPPAGQHWGVAVTVGAGINCVGVAPDGATTRFLALGELSGDWGGGGDLGSQAMWWAIRAEDGRGPETLLRTEVARHFGAAAVRDAVIAIYQRKTAREELRALAPLVFATARAGDVAARNLVRRLADEVTTMALTAIRRLDLAGAAVPVVLGGSLLAAADPLLTGLITAGLAAGAPAALPRIADVPPVAGAALLGLDLVSAAPSAETRLRAAFRDRAGRQRT